MSNRCIAPIQIKNPAFNRLEGTRAHSVNDGVEDRVLSVRCGRCEGCLKNRITEWSFRLEQEAKVAQFVDFVTLTYDPQFVPLTPSLLHTVDKTDVQKFLKRLRKHIKSDGHVVNLRYFICAEYGSKSFRPHYHGIFFNCPSKEYFRKAWTKRDKTIGNIHIGDSIDNGAVPYTLKYMYKKGMVPAFEGDDRATEFRIMSNKLGANYLTQAMIDWHLADFENRQYCQFRNGAKIGLPRYYREKLIDLAQQDDFVNNRPIRSRAHFRQEIPEKEDFRTIQSKVGQIKKRQAIFERTKNQEQRNKI